MKVKHKKDINEEKRLELKKFLLNVKYVITDSDLDGITSYQILKLKNPNCKLIGILHRNKFFVNEIPEDLSNENTVFLDTVFPKFVSIDNHDHIRDNDDIKGITFISDNIKNKYPGSTSLLMAWLMELELTPKNMFMVILPDGFIRVCKKFKNNTQEWMRLFNQQDIFNYALEHDPILVGLAKQKHDMRKNEILKKYNILIAERVKVNKGDFYYGIRYDSKTVFKNNFKIYQKKFQ